MGKVGRSSHLNPNAPHRKRMEPTRRPCRTITVTAPRGSFAIVRWLQQMFERSTVSKTCCGCWLALLLMMGLVGYQRDATTNDEFVSEGQRQVPAESFLGSRAGDGREVAGIKLCWCPPGRFRMGSPPDEPERRPDEAQVDVTLTKGF